jgi:hypothetical protein
MRKAKPKLCKICGRSEADGVPISRRKLCRECAMRRMLQEISEMARREGEFWEIKQRNYYLWRNGMGKVKT